MHNDFEDYCAGQVPWVPPPDFENPVPEPGEARRRAIGSVLPKLIVLAVLLGAGLLIYNSAGDVKNQINDKIDEVQRDIEKAVDESNTGTSDNGSASSSSDSDSDSQSDGPKGNADGKTSLPGGYASATFTVDGYMSETQNRSDIDGPYDGSTWQLTQVGNNGVSYAALRYMMFQPPITNASERQSYLNNTFTYDRSVAEGTPKITKTRVDGRPATEITYTRKADGATQRTVWVIGNPSSYELACTISKALPQFAETCDQLIDSLKFSK